MIAKQDANPQLIIVTGLPTSGKSTRAAQLAAHLQSRIDAAPPGPQSAYRVHLISDDGLSIPRSVYDLSRVPEHARSANAAEKDARAAVYGAVKRVLSDRDIVVLDGLNYIKGWRYQLFCEAKGVRTGCCVLQVGCGVGRARGVNEGRLRRRERARGEKTEGEAAEAIAEESQEKTEEEEEEKDEEGIKIGEQDTAEPYEPENWENLVFRYEEPNPMTRWDSPLFALVWDDDEARARDVYDSIWDALAGDGKKVVKPNQATVQRGRDASGDYLYVLDQETQGIVKAVMEGQGEEGGGEVRIPGGGDKGDLVVELPGEKVGFPRLQRLRRAFVGLTRGGIGLEGVGGLGPERVREGFVGYLNDAFEREG